MTNLISSGLHVLLPTFVIPTKLIGRKMSWKKNIHVLMICIGQHKANAIHGRKRIVLSLLRITKNANMLRD